MVVAEIQTVQVERSASKTSARSKRQPVKVTMSVNTVRSAQVAHVNQAAAPPMTVLAEKPVVQVNAKSLSVHVMMIVEKARSAHPTSVSRVAEDTVIVDPAIHVKTTSARNPVVQPMQSVVQVNTVQKMEHVHLAVTKTHNVEKDVHV